MKISSLAEDEAKAEERIAELKRDLQETSKRTEEMEKEYVAVAYVDEDEWKMGENEEEEEEGREVEKK